MQVPGLSQEDGVPTRQDTRFQGSSTPHPGVQRPRPREVRSPRSLTCCLCKVGRIRLSLPSCRAAERVTHSLWGQLSPRPVHPSILFIFYTEHGETFLETNQSVLLPQLLGPGSAGCSGP